MFHSSFSGSRVGRAFKLRTLPGNFNYILAKGNSINKMSRQDSHIQLGNNVHTVSGIEIIVVRVLLWN